MENIWVGDTYKPTFESRSEFLGQVTSSPNASVSSSVKWVCSYFSPWLVVKIN